MKNSIYFLGLTLIWAGCATSPETKQDRISSIPVIDTHIHLYDPTRPEGLPWPPDDDPVLYRPVLPEHFDQIAEENNLAATVIVEASEWHADNQWILDLTAHAPNRYIGLVGSLEIGTPDFKSHLTQLSENPRYVGIRMRERSGGENFFTEDVWQDLKILAEMDQTLDVLMFQFSLQDISAIATQVPKLKILINHVAGADIDGNAVDPTWLSDLQQAASHSNVYCKVSGLFQQSHQRPSPIETDYYRPVLDALWNTFGEDRLVYGSNWPVSNHGGSYAAYKGVVLDYFTPKGQQALEKLFYRNALSFYGISEAILTP